MKSEKREEFLEVVNQMTASTQDKEGYISLNFYEDTARPDNFVVEDENANKHHTQTAHFNTFVKGMSEFLCELLYAEAYDAFKI
ncbi:antibiotic biosynthesis monooxygenase [Clostridium sp. DL-VIII]|uniref:putative quinol monooxygenase n=1 Tax=Clostridium sp. DL-VIII TaxID=641107 RepID=UPI001FA76F71|nr:antibiotic biosynthesis monooxygenase [Clostridium sp. DL-VIII]